MKNLLNILLIAIFISACSTQPARQINKCYWVVGDHIENWREWHDPQFKTDNITKSVLENSDSATFEILENPYSTTCYGKDKNQVYMNFYIIEGADPETFSFLGEFYARDKSHIFHTNKMINEANVETFEVFEFNSGNSEIIRTVADAKDDKHIYNNGWIKDFSEKVDIRTFVPINAYYFKDKDHIYRGEDTGKPIDENIYVIEEADPNSFEILDYSEGFYAKDSTHIFLNAYGYKFISFIPEDIQSFEILNIKYSKDINNVYYYGEVLDGADAASFQKEGENEGKDKNGSWSAKGELK